MTITQSIEDTIMPVQGRGYGSMPEGVKGKKSKKKRRTANGMKAMHKSMSNAAMSGKV